MLLLIIVSSILVFTDAIPNYSISQIDRKLNYSVNEISNILETNKISAIKEFENQQLFTPVPPDATLITVSKTVNFLIIKFVHDK